MKPAKAHDNYQIPGIKKDGGSFLYSLESLPASDHFFQATHYRVNVKRGNLNILFGNVSSFSPSREFNTAIEINFPIRNAVMFLCDAISVQLSLDKKKTFLECLRDDVKNAGLFSNIENNDESENDTEDYLVPSVDKNRFRNFPSNISTSTLSNGQGMLEFFEAPPEMIANLVHNRSLRPNSGIKSIVSIILSPSVLLNFFEDVEKLLGPYKQALNPKGVNI